MSQFEDIVIGIGYICLTTICIVSCGLIVKVVHLDKEFGKQPVRRIIVHLGIAEIVGLFTQYFMAIFCIFGETFNPWLNKIVGATQYGSWLAYISLTTFLTLNRFAAICFRKYAPNFFNEFDTTLMISATWLIGVVDAAFYVSPLSSYVYVVESYEFKRDFALPLSAQINAIEQWFIDANCAITAGLYMLVAAFLLLQKYKQRNTITTIRRDHYEIRVLSQTFLISGYMAFITHVDQIFSWFGVEHTKWCLVLIQCLFIFTGAVNPFIYITMNRRIRRDFFKQFGIDLQSAKTINQAMNKQRMPNLGAKNIVVIPKLGNSFLPSVQ